jgi:hypothetical protein
MFDPIFKLKNTLCAGAISNIVWLEVEDSGSVENV